MFSNNLSSSFIANPLQVLMLSIHLIFGLPRALPPGMFPSMIFYSRLSSSFLIICPKYVSFLFLIDCSSCLSVFALCSTHSFVFPSIHDICSTCPRHFISNALIFVSSRFLMVQLLHPYVATGHTKGLSSFTFVVFD